MLRKTVNEFGGFSEFLKDFCERRKDCVALAKIVHRGTANPSGATHPLKINVLGFRPHNRTDQGEDGADSH